MRQRVRGRLQRIIRLHFDAKEGSRYWLDKEEKLGFRVPDRIKRPEDLWKLGPMALEDLSVRPIEDFIPAKFLKSGRPIVAAETGGATGRPKATAYFEDEFVEVFVRSFLAAACALEFSCKGRWLWIGPGGPHIIGKAANAIARVSGGCDAFSVDFDPRWYRKLAPESAARRRYMEHLVQQALDVMDRQEIRCLFSTPVVLCELASRLNARQCAAIGGIYLGGMAIEEAALASLRSSFPNAKLISGYGNTLFGVCHSPQDLSRECREIRYFPQSPRLCLSLVRIDDEIPDAERIRMQVREGEEGQVLFHRLDESFFLPNVLERDRGILVKADEEETAKGFFGGGVAEPRPLQTKLFKVDAGIY
jgi:hypothetical protein